MFSRRIASALTAAALIGGAASAESVGGRYSVGFYGGGAQGDFSELNSFFSFYNEHSGVDLRGDQEYGPLESGVTYMGDVRYGFTDNLVVGLSLGYSEFSFDVNENISVPVSLGETIDYIGMTLERTMRVRSAPIMVSGYYYLPVMVDLNVYGGAGIGFFGTELRSESFHDFVEEEDRFYQGIEFALDPFQSGNRRWTGTEVGYQVALGGEYSFTSHLSLAGEATYRSISVPEIEDALEESFTHYELYEGDLSEVPFGSFAYLLAQDDLRVISPTGDPVAIELSGITLSLGLRVTF